MGMVLVMLRVLVVLLVGKVVAVVVAVVSLVMLVVVEVLFVEKTNELLVTFELPVVPIEVLAGLSNRVKELMVMSGSGLKPGGQRMQAQERILVEEICIEVVVNLLSEFSDDREEERFSGNLSSCNMSSVDESSSDEKLSSG